MLTLMQFFKFRIVIFSCKWGAQLTIQICYPSTGILPSAILGNGGGNVSKSKFYTSHTPVLICTYSWLSLHFCAIWRGNPQNRHPSTLSLLFQLPVCLLWHDLCKTFFRKQQMDCCWACLLACMGKVLNARSRGGGKPTAVWRPGRRRGGCAFCGSPPFLKSGTLWLVRK